MPIMFNSILREARVSPADVRLLRHKDRRASKGQSPYELWRDNRAQFDVYQSGQNIERRGTFDAPYWASFVVNFKDETMFAGLYRAKYQGLLDHDRPMPHRQGATEKAGSSDFYELVLDGALSDLIGRLFVNWGAGALAWVQYADRNDKCVTEVRTAFKEEAFPGFLNFIQPLSMVDRSPQNWIAALRASRGVYLLTCPRTKEQYVGSATGEDGFWGRWESYTQTGHGGNVGLKERDPSDYQVSILEVAGTSATAEDILQMEGRWQRKLQTCEMGLNRNIAGPS